MTHDDPLKRPTIDEVSLRFKTTLKSLSSWKLRSRVQERIESFLVSLFIAVLRHFY